MASAGGIWVALLAPMGIWNDCRFGVRQLRKNPGFTLVVIATLGLCLGANTAVYSVLDAVLLHAIPLPHPDRLALVTTIHRKGGAEDTDTSLTGGQFEFVRDHATNLDVAAYGSTSGVNFAADGRAELVRQQRVSSGFFRVLGVAPLAGREFLPSEDVSGGPALVVLSYDFWQRVFFGQPSVIGRALLLRGQPYTVIGIMPRGFQTQCWCGDSAGSTVGPADLWTPLRPSRFGEGSGNNYGVVARLRPGVSWSQAGLQVRSLSAAMERIANTPRGVTAIEAIEPFQRGITDELRPGLLITWAAVIAVLLIGCVNVAGLLLARAAARQREVATRMALGGSRAAIVRQLLIENLLLAFGGCALGLALGVFAVDWLRQLGADHFALWRPIALDARVFGGMASLSALTGLLFGLAPAFATSRVDLRGALAEGGRSATRSRRQWSRGLLVIGEVALSLVLLVSAGLLLKTLRYLDTLSPGFDPNHVVAAEASLQDARYQTAEAVNRLFSRSLTGIRRIPGVESAAVALTLPYERPLNDGFRLLDSQDRQMHPVELVYVTPDYFQTLGIPLLRGRVLTDSDTAQSRPVVVVSASFAARYYRGREVIGGQTSDGEIVGMVGDVQQHSGIYGGLGPLTREPTMYVAGSQLPDRYFQLVHTWFSPKWAIRTTLPTGAIAREVQRALASVDPLLPIGSFLTINQIERRVTENERYRATLLSVLATLALVLAALGLYGLIAQTVAQRTREWGVRLALGAAPLQIVGRVVASGLLLAGIGAGVGLVLAFAALRYLQHLLWGVRAGDPATLALSLTALLGSAALATLAPALRILQLDPAHTLRDE